MAEVTVEPITTFDVNTQVEGKGYTVSIANIPTFTDLRQAERVAAAIRGVLAVEEAD